MSADPAVQPPPDPTAHQTITDVGRRRAVLVAVCIALMAVIASVTGLNVAQPDLAVAFAASQHTILWIINAYTLTLAALLLPLGAVGDRWGRKRVLLAGLVLFGIANVVGAVAPTSEVMLAARVLSGVGAAMIMPITLAVITTTFPPQERSRAIGIWTAVAGGGGLLGMFLSAVLVDLATWRLLFVLPVVLVVIAGVMTVHSVPDSREIPTHGFDSLGALTSGLAVVGLTLALHEGPARGWSDPLTLAGLVAGGGAAVAFVLWERRRPGPLLDVRLFGRRNLSGGSVVLLAVFGVQAGVSVVLYPFFQTVFDWSGLQATLGLLPMAGLMMVSAGIAPRLAERTGDRATMAAGVALVGAGLVLLAVLVSADGGYLAVLPGMATMGLGMGLSMTPATTVITASLPRDRQGVASALNDVTREVGAAVGVALLGALLTAGYRDAVDARLTGFPDATADAARQGVATAVHAAGGAGDRAPDLVRAAQESLVIGWQQSMWVGVGLMVALLAFLLARGPQDRAGAVEHDAAANAHAPAPGTPTR